MALEQSTESVELDLAQMRYMDSTASGVVWGPSQRTTNPRQAL
jgi:hypothetical protein